MGISGFYSHCKKKVPEAFKTVNILEEIERYVSENEKSPVIVVNLSTMCYHYRANMGFFLAEHRINKIKNSVERIFERLETAGAKLIFMFKRAKFDDPEFIAKSVQNYRKTQDLMQKMERAGDNSEKMKQLMKNSGQLPHNMLVLLAMIQSAKKFGKVHQINSYDIKPAVLQSEFITNSDAKWVIGLDTYFFFMEGDWKILADDTMDQKTMQITEIDKNAIMKHFDLMPIHLPLFATFTGDFEAEYEHKRKLTSFFGSFTKFENVTKFIKEIEHPLTEESYKTIAKKIFGAKFKLEVLENLKKSVEQFENRKIEPTGIDAEIIDLIKDDFLSYAPQILLRQVPIFIMGNMTDYLSDHTCDYNDLVLPLIQKTAGILLKNSENKDPLKVIAINPAKCKFETENLEPIYPDFDVPSLKSVINGELATYDKEKMLFFVIGEKLEKMEIPFFGQQDIIDSLILLHLINKNKITLLEARCILKTIVDSRKNIIPTEDCVPPKKINTRAIRCAFLYMKLFFELHSCLGALGMKNYCPEFMFDGLYFQKMYALNVLGEEEEEEEDNDDEQNDIENEPPTTKDANDNEIKTDKDEEKPAEEEVKADKKPKEAEQKSDLTQLDIVDSLAKILSL